jgi:cAMP-dependent protein kinase regulator
VELVFGRAKDEDVVALIAAKKYARAIEILKEQVKKRGASPSLRMQLADVLILAGKTAEAVTLLLPLADQYAREGFAAKAVSVLKKVQKIDPGRRDVEGRLARLIEEKQREAVVLPLRHAPEIGIEEIGMEPPPGGSLAIPHAEATSPDATIPRSDAPPEPTQPPAQPWRVSTAPTQAPAAAEGAPAPAARPTAPPSNGIEDYDLLYSDASEEEAEEIDVGLTEEPAASVPEAESMSDGRFAEELMSLVDSIFQEPPASGATAQAPPAGGAPRGGSQIVVSPLFRDFSVDEMVAVIHGLKLLAVERGDVILREGQAGGSLYMLTSGRVRAFRKDPASGKQVKIGDLMEGAFFGEMSILTGKPRMATVVALMRCELLELDRPTLDRITQTHPHVWDVLREFAEQRAAAARG